MNCRHCGARLQHTFLDLGCSPLSNAYIEREALDTPETYYPLRVLVCTRCWLVQTQDFARADEIFDAQYAYFSSVSQTWLDHAERYCSMAQRRFDLHRQSFVVEIGCNDGYLLRNFIAVGIRCLGVEPTASTATAAERLGIPVRRDFFGSALAESLSAQGKADLVIANNVFAHVPDINDFARGLRTLLAPAGSVTLEFPHLLRLIEQCQFDTIYHEHFSYLSLSTVAEIFETAGLRVYDAEQLSTHGGSLRVYGCHTSAPFERSSNVDRVMREEQQFGLGELAPYTAFQSRADRIKDDLLAFLIDAKREGRRVAAYGAAAKGNTLLNYAGVKRDLISYVCDAAPSKQDKFLPGSRIPVVAPQRLAEDRPDVVLVLPWNLVDEICMQQRQVRDWGGRFAVAIPQMRVF